MGSVRSEDPINRERQTARGAGAVHRRRAATVARWCGAGGRAWSAFGWRGRFDSDRIENPRAVRIADRAAPRTAKAGLGDAARTTAMGKGSVGNPDAAPTAE